MPSRREQIQSYQYLMQRVVSAFVVGETDPVQPPMRRLAGAGFASVVAALLVLAGVGVFGLVKHGGNTSWRNPAAIIIEKETGTRYVYRDDVLYPVANYVSALLVLGGPAQTVSVSRESLVGAARGPLIGISGAPDALAPATRLLGAPWSVCSQPGRDASGTPKATSWLLAGWAPADGTALGDNAVVVREVSTRRVYLVWHGYRYLALNAGVVAALGFDQQPQIPVDAGWLNAIPAGKDLTAIVAQDGGKSPSGAVLAALPDALTGQIYSVDNGGRITYYLVRAADLLPITALEQIISLADPTIARAYPGQRPTVKQTTATAIAGVPKGSRPDRTAASTPEQLPALAPGVSATGTLCTRYQDATSAPEFVYNVTGPADSTGIATFGSTTAALVDRVVVRPGYGAVVQAAPSGDSPVSPLFLVTDQGRRYPIPNAQELAWLGYQSVKPLVLPASVVSRMPGGPALDPDTAMRPVPAG